MIDHVRCRPSEGGGRIIAEGQDAGIGNLLGQKVSQPKGLGLRMGPGVDGIATQSMHGDDAEGNHTPVRCWQPLPVVRDGSRNVAYSMVDADTDPLGGYTTDNAIL